MKKSVTVLVRKFSESLVSEVSKLISRLEIVESIPQNLSFEGFIPRSTFESWSDLLSDAHSSVLIAAYKSSLRGKHVFGNMKQKYSSEVIVDLFSFS